MIASTRKLGVWNAENGRELKRFPSQPRWGQWRIAWSPNDAWLVVGNYNDDVVRFWDVRDLLPEISAPVVSGWMRGDVPRELQRLPGALSQHLAMGIPAPVSLIRDVWRLTGGQTVETPWLAELASHDGLRRLVALKWPEEARLGLVALLLKQLPFSGWQPPDGVAPVEVRDGLLGCLAHSEACEPVSTESHSAGLRAALEQIDERLLTLLTILGPAAVASDPALPLRLLPRVRELPALSEPQRRLVGLRFQRGSHGPASGSGPGNTRAGIDQRGTWVSLIPSQWALPSNVLAYRHQQRELLYRAREGEEPPRLRPTVLLLDVTPPMFGPPEQVARLAADTVARSLVQARVPLVLVTTSSDQDRELIRPVERASDLLEIWTTRTLNLANSTRSLRLAEAVRRQLRDGVLEPIVLVLSHTWFGWDAEPTKPQHLRGLFIEYPRHAARPSLADVCERWESHPCVANPNLPRILAQLIG
jgi:ATP-dependent Clp protease ATP-binding subunit ClpC